MKQSAHARAANIIDPRSIAIIGASERNRIAVAILRNVRDFEFDGEVFLVNPNYSQIDGRPCYPSVEAIPVPVDLAVLVVPADVVPDAVESCVRAGVPGAVIMSAGFAEGQRGDGMSRDRRLREIVKDSDIVICGPNSEGHVNVKRELSLCFSGSVGYDFLDQASGWAEPGTAVMERIAGNIAVVAQSGGLGFSMFGRGVEIGLGFSHVVSVGNEFDLDVLDCADYLLAQPEVDIVAMYVEGFHRPDQLRRVAQLARAAGKAIVIGKAGDSSAGSDAVMSHTGHLAGAAAVNRAAFDAMGIISVADQEELLDACSVLSNCPPLKGNRVGVVSWSGGSAVWMADACERYGLQLPELDDDHADILRRELPDFANIRNPIDITGAAKKRPGEILSMVASAPDLDALVMITPLHQPGSIDSEVEHIALAARRSGKPIVVYSYTNPHPANRALLRKIGIPVFESSTRVARALATLLLRTRIDERSIADILSLPQGTRRAKTERETSELLRSAGFPVARQTMVQDRDQAARAAAEFGGPVALKLQAPSLPHKLAAGGVLLNLSGDDAVRGGFDAVMSRAGDLPDVEGVLVQEMVRAGVELIVGIDNTSGFGPMVVVGFGGSDVEEVSDTALRCAPLSSDDVRAMLGELRHGALLTEPLAGMPDFPVEELIDFVVRLSLYAVEHADRIAELDINPVVIGPGGLQIVDSMMVEVE